MLNIREIPFVRLIVPFILGILSSHFIIPGKNIITIILILLLFAVYKKSASFRYKWLFGIPITVLLFFTGYQLAFYHNELNKPEHFSNFFQEGSYLVGNITDIPQSKIKSTKFKLAINTVIDTSGSEHYCQGNLLVYINRDSSKKLGVSYGDRLIIKGNIKKIPSPKNPDAFDYKNYLHFQNIHFQTFLAGNQFKIISSNHGNILITKALAARTFFLKTLQKYIPENNELAVASALIVGYRETIPDEIKKAYAETGAIHVLAVSGLHVGIVLMIFTFLLFPFLPKTTFQKIIKNGIIISGIWIFALITGASPSVTRAATMFSLLVIGVNIQRSTNIYNTIAGSAFLMLLLNPFLLYNISFQLSYAAVLGIVFFQPKLYKLIFFKNKIFSYVWTLTTVSIAAQLSTLPLTIYYFHKLTTMFWLSGLIVVPAAFIILLLGLSMFVIEAIVPIVNIPIGFTLYWIIKIINHIIFGIQQIPFSFIEGLWLTKLSTYSMIGLIVLVSIFFLQKKIRWLYYALTLLLFSAINYSFSSIKTFKKREITFYNIRKETLIDFFDGKRLITLSGFNAETKSEQYAAKNHRWAKKVKNRQRISLKENKLIPERHFCKQGKLLQFYDTRIVLIDSFLPEKTEEASNVDIVLLTQNSHFTVAEISSSYKFKILLFDNTNRTNRIAKWKQSCEAQNIAYHDLHNGAYVYEE